AVFGECTPESPVALMFQAMAHDTPLRNLARMGDAIYLAELMEGLATLNGKARSKKTKAQISARAQEER
ncbi:MAG: hypothetical protein Q8M76_13100, partial [Spirochaetaceae bacterium]|nr:hypothetical protein [Spirochaetaceae bacterium]